MSGKGGRYWQRGGEKDKSDRLLTLFCEMWYNQVKDLPRVEFKGEKPMKMILKTVALILVVVLVIGALGVANALFGNPISKAIASRSAERYLREHYSDMDLEITKTVYSLKEGYYYVYVESPSSVDTHFVLMMSSLGELRYDDYESVTSGRNTAVRINREYTDRVDAVLDSASFLYSVKIGFGEITFKMPENIAPTDHAINMSELIPDKDYDLYELGSLAGKLTLYIEDKTVSVERLAEILLGIRAAFDDAGLSFYTVDCVLEYARGDDGASEEGSVRVEEFLWADIYEQGLTERVEKANAEAKARLESYGEKKY